MDYPIVRPVKISTKGKKLYRKIWVWLTESRKWEIVEDYFFYVPWLDITLMIPEGFVFDGASIPRIFWNILTPTGIFFIPGLFHDFGYKYNFYINANGKRVFLGAGRKFFDKQFGNMSLFINDIIFLDNITYVALRGFGIFAWKKHRKEQKIRMKHGECC